MIKISLPKPAFLLKSAIAMAFAFSSPQSLQAQQVFNMVLENATKIVNSPTADFTATRIAQFKCTALTYLKSEAFKRKPVVTEQFLNTQAYYLSEYLTLFFNQVVTTRNMSEKARKERIMAFAKASINNPLFNDPDKETTRSYIDNESELTPFSLDTDWQKAFEEVKKEINKK